MTAPETLAERLTKCVLPLEWDDWSASHRIVLAATTATGVYRVTQRHFPEGMFTLEKPNNDVANYSTIEAAQAAAQADYEAGILAALDMDAIARLVAEAVEAEREGCARFVDCGCDPAKKAAAVNGGDRWRACQEANCGAQDAAAIRALPLEPKGDDND